MEILQLAQHKATSFVESDSNKGFINYGEDNLFPQYLIELYTSSATHNALCTSIAYMIFGEGVQVEDLDAKLKVKEWGLNDEIRKACLDLKVQGGFYLEVIYSVDRSTISKVRHLPFENVRSGEVDDDEKCNFYFYSRDWSDRKIEPQKIRAFSPENKNDYPHQILSVNPFTLGSFYYPKPDYIGSVNYIELDKEISIYHINNIKNGMSPSFVINFKSGTPDAAAKRQLRLDIEKQLQGSMNSGKFIMTFSDQPDRAPDFEPFPLSDADKQYQFLSTEVSDKIMVGHRVVSSAMFGVKTAGQLGNTQELEVASELFNKQVVKPYQDIVEQALSSVLVAAGVDGVVSLGEKTEAQPPPAQLSEQYHDDAFNALCEFGEEVNEEWELIDVREVDYDREESDNQLFEFTRVVPDKRQLPDEQDTEVIKVRYRYAPQTINQQANPSRKFCVRMVQANRVYRKKDIQLASNIKVNKGWGAGGADTYDIWKFKGGGSCAHYWERLTYLKKTNAKISVNKAKKLIRELDAERLKANPNYVAKRPRDMANRGFLPSNQSAKNIKTPR